MLGRTFVKAVNKAVVFPQEPTYVQLLKMQTTVFMFGADLLHGEFHASFIMGQCPI